MSIWIFIALTLGSLGAAQLLLWRQASKLSKLEGEAINTVDLRTYWQAEIDQAYGKFSAFFKNLAHLISYLVLVVLHQIAVLSRRLVVRAESRFSRMVGVVGGRADLTKRGSVSFFLAELKRDN